MSEVGRRPGEGTAAGARWLRPLLLALAAGSVGLSSGCVERILQIRSEPSGAEVFINGQRVGLTPLDHRFDFYGTFDVSLRARSHFSVRQLETVSPPWYELFPIDFLTENLVPIKIRDRHSAHYVLPPARALDDQDIDREEAAILLRMAGLEDRAAASPEEPPRP